MEEGEGRESRVLEVRDQGIGIAPERHHANYSQPERKQMPRASKTDYLVGAYGQGGSSTFAFSRYSLIACRYRDRSVGFTIVKFLDLPVPNNTRQAHYVFLVLQDGGLPYRSVRS